MKNTETNSIKITDYTPGLGHTVFVPVSELAEFRLFLAQLSPDERSYYGPLSQITERPAERGAQFTFGSECSHEDMMQLCTRFVIRA